MSRRLIRAFLLVGVVGVAAYGLYRLEQRQAVSRLALASDSPGTAETAVKPSPDASLALPDGRSSVRRGASERASGEKADGTPVDAAVPLRPGETLDFKANVSQLNNVANLRLQVVERRNFLGKSVWHLQASAHTENPLRFVFALDDQFDSYSDAVTLNSLQYELRLNERGQKIDSIQRLTSSGSAPASAGAVQTRVLPGTRDPLGMMQYLRTVDWSHTPEVHGPVYDGHKLYDVRAKLDGSESVTVPAGTYEASRITIRVFDSGMEMKDASFALYLAKDQTRTPVLLEAVLPFAAARVELNKIQ